MDGGTKSKLSIFGFRRGDISDEGSRGLLNQNYVIYILYSFKDSFQK